MALRQSYRFIGNVSHRTACAVTLLFMRHPCHENLPIHKTVNGYYIFNYIYIFLQPSSFAAFAPFATFAFNTLTLR
jgi:hypothetical protein